MNEDHIYSVAMSWTSGTFIGIQVLEIKINKKLPEIVEEDQVFIDKFSQEYLSLYPKLRQLLGLGSEIIMLDVTKQPLKLYFKI